MSTKFEANLQLVQNTKNVYSSLLTQYGYIFCFAVAQQPYSGTGRLISEVSRSHTDTPHSVVFLWGRDRPVAETSTGQHTTLTRDKHPCPRRNSNPQSQQASGCRPTPLTARPLGSAYAYIMSHKFNHYSKSKWAGIA
jgi:hypothetical protein